MRAALTLSLALWLTIPAAAQQPSGPQTGQPTEGPVPAWLRVRVQVNDRPLELRGVRIQALMDGYVNRGETFTNERGEADLRIIAPGNYTVVVSSPELMESVSQHIYLQPRETTRFLFVNVAIKPMEGGARPLTGLVNALDLNAPRAAQREYERGGAAFARKNWQEARSRFEKALELYDQYPSAHNNLGVALMNLGDHEGGRRAFERAIALNPQLAGAHLNLARILVGREQYAEAEASLLRSLAADPQEVEALTLLTLCKVATGKMEEAVATARKVHDMPHPNGALAHLLAARALQELGRPAEAAAEYRQFLQEAPQHPSAPAAERSLAALAQD